MKRPRFSSGLCGLAALAAFGGQDLHAQGTAFMYQGRPNNGGTPANGSDDFRFSVYDSVTNGSLIAGPVTNIATAVAAASFSATLDFGPGLFPGPAQWLDLAVRTNGAGTFTALTPRQPILAVPYAVFALFSQQSAGHGACRATGRHPIARTIARGSSDQPYLTFSAPTRLTAMWSFAVSILTSISRNKGLLTIAG